MAKTTKKQVSPKQGGTKSLLINLGIIIGVLVLLLLGSMQFLKVYTKHGEGVEVPDLSDLHINQIETVLANLGLKFQIADSSFQEGRNANVVYDQDPRPGNLVKTGRTIYVYINTSNVPNVLVPIYDGQDADIFQKTLDIMGLKVGEIKFRPNIAHNVVLRLYIGEKEIKPGEKIPRGTVIDLLVANSRMDTSVYVPNLVGLTLADAEKVLWDNLLDLGSVIGNDTTITDQKSAFVVQQKPMEDPYEMVKAGSLVDVWIGSIQPQVIDENTSDQQSDIE